MEVRQSMQHRIIAHRFDLASIRGLSRTGLVGVCLMAMVATSGAWAQPGAAPSASTEQPVQPPPTGSQVATSHAATNPKDQEEAMQRFNRAVGLYEEQDYAAALIEFRRAYELAPTYKLLYQIGQVSYKLRDYAGALRAFERYLKEGGAEISEQRQREVQEEVALLRSQTGKLQITANVIGATVLIDDIPVGVTPLEEPVLVSMGERKVTVRAQGRETVTRRIAVAGQETKAVNVDLPTLVAETKTVTIFEKDTPSKMTTLSWVGVGASVALAAGATITGVMALRASSKLSDMSYVGTEPSTEIKDQQSQVKALAVTTDVLGGIAVVTLATTLVLTFTRPDSPDGLAATEPQAQARAKGAGGRFSTASARRKTAVAVRPAVGVTSIGLTGEF